ncbi:hypothetical protein MIND_00200100 [Mycena indigotica]|uniref:F-box domain-containing protein n=1 Tax=Mycena indigotica TaxID=2126181 RepID=A0A8H6T9M7_9AGAR|nr:uncharacterized protein MIND_00200100 [Mycena indigotica]KAF7311890.1 hypothetical protein MIND_00200100 [Mycena indigotica]
MLQNAVGPNIDSTPPQLETLHRCFRIPEIILQVFAAVSVQDSPNATLAALARTCRLFEQPALEYLWSDPGTHTLDYVLNCLPHGLFTGNRYHDVLSLSRAIRSSDWERPRRYCNLVRTLSVSYGKTHKQLATLGQFYPELCLFPQLRQLVICGYDTMHLQEPLLRTLLSPTLKHIELDEVYLQTISLFPIIIHRAPQLTTLIFDAYPGLNGPIDHAEALSELLQSLHHLQVLTLAHTDDTMLSHVSRLRKLRKLTINRLDLPVASQSTTLQALDSLGTFPSLETLSVARVNLRALTAVIQLIRISPLRKLDICPLPESHLTTADTTAFCRSVGAYINRQTLQQFDYQLRSHHRYPVSLVHVDISADAFRSLQDFPGLTHLYMQCDGKYSVNDGLMDDLARSWPALETFTLCPSKTNSARKTIKLTLVSLVAFATHCSRLVALNMSFDATALPSTMAVDGSGEPVIQTSLVRLSTGYSPIRDPVKVAHFLSRLFPRLDLIKSSHCVDSDSDDSDSVSESAPHPGRPHGSKLYAACWKDVAAKLAAATAT